MNNLERVVLEALLNDDAWTRWHELRARVAGRGVECEDAELQAAVVSLKARGLVRHVNEFRTSPTGREALARRNGSERPADAA